MSHTRRIGTAFIGLAVAAATTVIATGPSSAAGVLDGLSAIAGVPGDVRSPDLNADGHPDLTAVLFGTNMLSVRINNGDGTFGPVHRYSGSFKSSIQESGDFNGDGKLDVAVSNTAGTQVSIFSGNGDGTLQPEHTATLADPNGGLLNGVGAFGLVAHDMNGDGTTDLVAATTGLDHLNFLSGRGDGTFARAVSSPSPSPLSVFPFALAYGDFNHDGRPDLVSGGVGSVTTYDGRGDGTFAPTATVNLPGLVVAWIDIADVNGDGNDDVLLTGTGTQNIDILLGNGDGTFRQGDDFLSGGLAPQGLDTGDLNGDGLVDIAVANTATLLGQGNIAVFLNTGNGHFQQKTSYLAGLSPFTTSIADFNGDGKADLMGAVGVPSQVSIALGRGDGTFGAPRYVSM